MQIDKANIKWKDDTHTILCCDLADDWNWQDLHTALDAALKMIEGETHRVDLIVRMQGTVKVAPNAMSELLTLAKYHPQNLTLMVFITVSTTFLSLYNVISRVSNHAKAFYRLTDSKSGALQIIKDDRDNASV